MPIVRAEAERFNNFWRKKVERELSDVDYLAIICYLRRNYKTELESYAFDGGTVMHRLTVIKERVEMTGETLEKNVKDFIQRSLSYCKGQTTKIADWVKTPTHEEYYKFAKQSLKAQQENRELFRALKGKIIPVKFRNADRFGNIIGWISFKGIDETMPIGIDKKLFMLPKDLAAGVKTGLIYNTICTGITNGGAIRVKII